MKTLTDKEAIQAFNNQRYLFYIVLFLLGFIIFGDYGQVNKNTLLGAILIIIGTIGVWYTILKTE